MAVFLVAAWHQMFLFQKGAIIHARKHIGESGHH